MQPRNFIIEQMMRLSACYSMKEPPSDLYIANLCEELHNRKWTARQLFFVINHLKTDEEYAQDARYERYPTVQQLESTRKKLMYGQRDTQFRSLLTSYLSGSWWAKEDLLNWCNGVELKAIEMAGGLEELYRRANDQKFPTDISRIMSEVNGHKALLPDDVELGDLPQMIENNKTLSITEKK